MKYLSTIIVLLVFLIPFTVYAGDINQDLIEAAKNGDIEAVKNLLEKDADMNAKDEDGRTAFRFSANGGHTEIVKFLLENGADVNAKTIDGGTALMLAADGGHTEIVKLLKEAGAKE